MQQAWLKQKQFFLFPYRLMGAASPNSSEMSEFSHTPTKSRLGMSPLIDLDDEDDEVETGSPNLQPKNLMDMFHDIEQDL